jgi:nucleoside-diphosphate-sugar epimerase
MIMKAKVENRPTILITGSAGLIGARLVEAFSSEYQVVGMDVKRPEQNAAGADWVECDLTKDASVAQALATVRQKYGNHLASVIHLAAYYDFSGEPSPLYRKLTVEGTRRMLQGLRQFETEQFIFSSTLLMMKPVEEGEVITERSPVEDEGETWDYPRSKIEAERVIRQERGNIPAVILRIAGVYNEDCHSIPIGQQISRIYEKRLESYFFPGDADHGQAFVHLNDLVDCFRRVVALRGELGQCEVFLIAEPEVMSYAELQDSLGNLIHGRDWPAIRIPKAVAKVGAWVQDRLAGDDGAFIKPWMVDLADAHYPVEIERARKRLGWEPTHRLRATLGEMVSRLKRDPQRWYQINGLPPLAESKERKAGTGQK